MGLEEELGELYAAEPDEFVNARKRLERSLREEGRAQEAEEVAGLRKPALPVFVANRLARQRPKDIAALIAAAEALAAAHEAGDAEALRAAHAQLGERVSGLVVVAADPAGEPLSAPMEQRLGALLRAAATDPETAALLRVGVLAEETATTGFEALAGLQIAPRRQAAAPARSDKATGRAARAEAARRARIEELEAELEDAHEQLRAAERALEAAEREAGRARKRVDDVGARLERARRAG
jgi:hypothetical protein